MKTKLPVNFNRVIMLCAHLTCPVGSFDKQIGKSQQPRWPSCKASALRAFPASSHTMTLNSKFEFQWLPCQSFGSVGVRPSSVENSGNGPSNNQQKVRSSKDVEDGLETTSESQRLVPHVKPRHEIHRERESEGAQETPSLAIWRPKQIKWVTLGDYLRGWPRIGMPRELL